MVLSPPRFCKAAMLEESVAPPKAGHIEKPIWESRRGGGNRARSCEAVSVITSTTFGVQI